MCGLKFQVLSFSCIVFIRYFIYLFYLSILGSVSRCRQLVEGTFPPSYFLKDTVVKFLFIYSLIGRKSWALGTMSVIYNL